MPTADSRYVDFCKEYLVTEKFDLETRAAELLPERPLGEEHSAPILWHGAHAQTKAIQLAREALAAQAEEIAERIEEDVCMSNTEAWKNYNHGVRDSAATARSFLPAPTKTKEQARIEKLEKVLRDLRGWFDEDRTFAKAIDAALEEDS